MVCVRELQLEDFHSRDNYKQITWFLAIFDICSGSSSLHFDECFFHPFCLFQRRTRLSEINVVIFLNPVDLF